MSTPAEVTATAALASPGDIIVMRDGVWQDADILFAASGTADNPITLRAQTLGAVHLTGQSRLRMTGNYLVVDGLVFTNGYVTNNDVIAFRDTTTAYANNSRLTNCAIINYNPANPTNDTKWVSLYGVSNRVESCYFRGKENVGTMLVVWVDASTPNYHVIRRNYFGPRPVLTAASNGGETIRVGTSDVSMSNSRTLVENNYFEQCNGDVEIISSKTCENIFRHNTFVDCEGSLSLRHGNRSVVEGNYFFGHNKQLTGGVRIVGEDHKIYNNYFQDLAGSSSRAPLAIMQGIVDSPLNGYFQVQRATVAFNTFVNCTNAFIIGLSGTSGTNVTTLPPVDCVFANNIVAQPLAGKIVDQRITPVNLLWEGNLLYGGTQLGITTNSGTIRTNPLMTVSASGLYRPSTNSPALNAAIGSYSFVSTDIEGQSRPAIKDIGCDQASLTSPDYLPLTASVVGPLWLSSPGTYVTWAKPADIEYGTALNGTHLNARANAAGVFVYDPPAGAVLNVGSNQILKAVFTPDDSVNFSVVTQTVVINVVKARPVISWNQPAAISYGTPLSDAELSAVTTISGSFSYTPGLGAILNASNSQKLTAIFTPADTANYLSATSSVFIDVMKTTPVIAWNNPSSIEQGTPLSGAQLNASVVASGVLSYNPPFGTVLSAGNNQTLSVTFTPFNTANFMPATATVTLNVTIGGKTKSDVQWSSPAPLLFGAPLGTHQLNATSSVPGNFYYVPSAGTVLPVGNHVLTARFVPTDAAAYTSVTNTVTINVVSLLTNPLLRVAYIVPTNRLAQTHAETTLATAIQEYQRFFALEMERNGFGPKTFAFETESDGMSPLIHTLRVSSTDIYLRGDVNGTRLVDAARAAGLPIGAPGQIWWLIAETHVLRSDGTIGGGFDAGVFTPAVPVDSGWFISGSDALALFQTTYQTNAALYDGYVIPELGSYPLLQDQSFPWFEGITLSGISSSSLGSGLRTLGQAFGLVSDYRNDENFNGNLMGFGFRGIRGVLYPERYPYNYCTLSPGSAMSLNVNPFFNPGRATNDLMAPTLTINTAGAKIPVNGQVDIAFTATDTHGLATALLKWHTDAEAVLIGEVPLSGTSASASFWTPYYTAQQTNRYTITVLDEHGNRRSLDTFIYPSGSPNHAPAPFVRVNPIFAGPGEDVLLDASPTYDAEHGGGYLEVEWDLDGDGIFDTAPSPDLFYYANFFSNGTRFITARITDPAGDIAVSAPVAVTIVPCATALSPTNKNHGYSYSTGSVTVTAGPKCRWTGTPTVDWIKPISGEIVGSGKFSYYTEPNPNFASRRGTIIIGDEVFTVTQDPAACTYSITTSRFHGRGAGTGTFKVTTKTNCPWTIVNTNSWITILGSTNQVDTQTITYSFGDNRTPSKRTGNITVNGEVCAITQWGLNCEIVTSPVGRIHSENSETGSVSVSVSSGCAWELVNTNEWIELTTTNAGTNSTTVGYLLHPNLGSAVRLGYFTIGTESFVITQGMCSFAVATNFVNHTFLSETGSIAVAAGPLCNWRVLNTNNWITLTVPDETNGVSVVTYTVASNMWSAPREGILTVAGTPIAITQNGKPCDISIYPTEFAHTEGSDFSEIEVTADTGCDWTVNNSASWVTILDGASGHGPGIITYSVQPNIGPARSTTLTVTSGDGVEQYVVTQPSGVRNVTANDIYIGSGETNVVEFTLDAHGGENALSFSLCFNTNLLTYVSAQLRPGGPVGSVLTTDAGQATQGRLGLSIALPPGWSMAPGKSTVIQVSFRGGAITGKQLALISACDSPVPQTLIDSVGRVLTANIQSPTAQIIGFCSVAEAIDAPQFNWTNSPLAWTCQTNVTHDLDDAATSAVVPDSGQSYFETAFVGPGTLTFWWKVSSEATRDLLRLYMDGTEQLRISGEVDWEWRTFNIPPGNHLIRWIYSKNSSSAAGADRAWVDEITYQPSAPVITGQPANQNVDSGSNATFTVVAAGQPPLSYQWLSNGMPIVNGPYIRGANTATLVLSNVQVSQAAAYSVIVSAPQGNTMSSNVTLAVTPLIPLATALDATSFAWINTGNGPWVGQTSISHDGRHSGRSGNITNSQSSGLSTTIVGPGTISFWWKVSSEPSNDRLAFSLNGSSQATISGEVDWQQKTYSLPSGTNTLLWNYSKNSSTSGGQDHGWVDEFRFIPTAVSITSSPTNQLVDQGATATLNVVAAGTPPILYQWRLNGTNISGATNAALVLPNVQPEQAGGYSVFVANAAGGAASVTAVLTVNRVVPLAVAVDTTNLNFATTAAAPWLGQTYISHDGIDAARSGAIGNSSSSSFSNTVVGPGAVSFWWKVSSESNDRVGFYINGSSQATMGGESNWIWRTFNVPSGNQNLEWRYTKNSSTVAGADSAWVDQIVYIPSNVLTAPVMALQPVSRTVVPPTNVTFTAVAVGSGPLSYQWLFNGTAITNGNGYSGVTTTNLAVTGATVAHNGSYAVVVSNAAGAIISAAASLVVVTAPVITSGPVSQNVLAGSSVTFSVSAIGQAPLSYQWMFNGTNLANGGVVSGATSANLTLNNVQAAHQGSYSVLVSNAAGVASSMQGYGALTTLEAARTASITNGEMTTIQSSVEGPGTIRFAWKVSSETNSDRMRFLISGVEQTNISGEVDWRDQAFTIGSGSQLLQWIYTKDAVGSAGQNAGWLDDVSFHSSNSPTAPTILVTPAAQTVAAGTAVQLNAAVSGSAPLSFQWLFNGAPLQNSATISGVRTPQLSIANSQPSHIGTYALSVSNGAGQLTTTGVVLNVTSAPPSITPVITLTPTSQHVSENATLTLNAAASGAGPLSYQWQFNGSNIDFTNAVGSASSTLVISNIQPSQAGMYSVIASNPAGTAVSKAAITVIALADAAGAPYLNLQMAGYTSWIAQTNVTHDGIAAVRSGPIPDNQNTRLETWVDGPGVVTFWWKVSCEPANDNLRFYIGATEMARISGEVDWQQQSFTVPSGQQILLKWRYGKDANAGTIAGQDAAWVDDVKYTYTGSLSTPGFTNSPVNQDVVAGSLVRFSAGVTGAPPLTFQWRLAGVPMANGPGISGATTPQLTLNNVQASQAGSYSLFVSNAAGTALTIPVSLGVSSLLSAPFITTQPTSKSVVDGETATFSVLANGTAPLSHQWLFNGQAIPGATNTVYVIAKPNSGSFGNYSAVVSNGQGSVTSAPASLLVRSLSDILNAPYLSVTQDIAFSWLVDNLQMAGPVTTNAGAILIVSTTPSIVSQPTNITVTAGSAATFSVTAVGSAPLSFQWRSNGIPLNDGAGIEGATASALTLNNVDLIDAAAYSVQVSNAVGTVTSSNALLSVISPPLITHDPDDQTVLEGTTVALTVGATGTSITYQWRRNGTNLVNGGNVTGVNGPTLVIANAQAAQSGLYSVVVANSIGTVVSDGAQVLIAAPMSVGESLNAPYLTWNTTVETPWVVQTNITHDGEGAARSGTITNGAVTWMETTVTGPGTIHYWWKVSSETNADFLTFYVGGAVWARISGEVDWQNASFSLPAGTITLRWAYEKDGSGTNGADRAWVDEVDFAPTTGPSVPVIVSEPTGLDVPPGTNVTFSVAALGTAPLTYQWRFEGQNLSDSPTVIGTKTPTLTLLNVAGANSGLYDVVVKNPYSLAISKQVFLNVVVPVPLDVALDTDRTNLVWIAGGYSPWFGQTEVNADRIDAAQSGPLPSNRTNYIQTIVQGPGAISFFWKASSETNHDRLRFSINGVEQANISGEVDWRARTFFVPLPNSVLQWSYTKDASNSAGLDRAYLDMVSFGPSAPIITNSGPDVSYVDQGTTLRLSVDASGTPKFSYRWSFNGTNLVDSDTNAPGPGSIFGSTGNHRLTISNAQPYQSGIYVCEVMNAAGTAVSDPLSVEIVPALPIAPALNTALPWETGGYAWWVGTTNVTHDGSMAARNGTLPNGQSTWMRTTVQGPGTLKFWWKASTETNADILTFSINGVDQAFISGNKNWEQKTYDLNGIGTTYVLQWEYAKNGLLTNGLDQVFVDEVVFSKAPPTVTNNPVSQTVDAGATVTFNVGARGTPPLQYVWYHNGVMLSDGGNITGSRTPSLRITGVQSGQAGTYDVEVINEAGGAISTPSLLTVIPIFPLDVAMDSTAPIWTSVSPAWVGQPTTTHDGTDAARSPIISDSQSSTMQAALVGPGTINFWWKVSSETNRDLLVFYVGNTEQARISGQVDWHQRTFVIGPGTNTLKWTYSKNSSVLAGSDRGWVDEFVFTPVPPSIVTQPVGKTVDQGSTISLSVTPAGTPPYQFSWRLNGNPIDDGFGVSGAHTGTLTFSNVQPSANGTYSVVVANGGGAVTSSNATLAVVPTLPLGLALNATNLTWTTNGSPAWVGQYTVSHDGEHAARISGVSDNSTSSFQTVLFGPGTFSFWWKVSSETNADRLVFYTNSIQVTSISGEVDWQEKVITLGSGTQTLKWSYIKNSSGASGQDRAWVDNAFFGAVAPTIAAQPTNQNVDVGGNAAFSVRVAGTPPFSYQWQLEGNDITDGQGFSGTTTSNLVITGVDTYYSGNLRVLISGPGGTAISAPATLTVYAPIPLTQALDTTGLNWTTNGSTGWVGHGLIAHDGEDAARSGPLGNNASNSMTATVTGPGNISFWWKVSSETNKDLLLFYTNNVEAARISGEVDWQFKTIPLAPGNQTLRWTYLKNGSATNGADRGWVDEVTFGSVRPTITAQPQAQNSDVGGTASFVVAVSGTPPFSYQWQSNGIDIADGLKISGATSSNLVLADVQSWQAGNYRVLISGPGGVTNSAPAPLAIYPNLSLAAALDVTGISWVTNSSPAGLASWVGHGLITHDGIDAARSSLNGANTSNALSAIVSGPGTISFWWKVSSETNNDRLMFFTNGVEAARISGEVDWQFRSFNLSSGPQSVQWVYGKNSTVNSGQDRGWLDQVGFGVVAPTIVGQPASSTVAPGSSANFNVNAAGTPVLAYQWLFNDAPLLDGNGISGSASPSLTISNAQAGRVGSYSVIISNTAGSVTSVYASLVLGTPSTNTGPVTLNESLDGGLAFTTGGTGQPWTGQRSISHDFVDAAQNGAVGDSTYTWIKTTVTGPGPLSFWWRTSSETNHDYLRFMLDAVDQVKISGELDWQQVTFDVPSGTHELQWRYSKNASLAVGQDRAWVDQIYFGANQPTNDPGIVDPPVILIQPASKTVDDGDTVGMTVAAASSHPLTYRWYLNGSNLLANGAKYSGATTPTLTITDVNIAQAGDYSVIVSNAGGWIPSASARLSVNPAIDLAEAVDTLELFVTTDGDAPWTGHAVGTHDGVDVARSGGVTDNQYSAMHTTVIGPGLLSFWWKISSETNADVLTFSMNGEPQAAISGQTDWRQRFVRINDGPQYLDWIYDKNSSGAVGSDRAWIDQLSFIADGATAPAPPAVGAMRPKISMSDTKARLTWTGRTDKTYKVFYKDNLSDPQWTQIDAEVFVTWRFVNGVPVTDSISAVFEEALAGRTRFYRVLEY